MGSCRLGNGEAKETLRRFFAIRYRRFIRRSGFVIRHWLPP
jgi:hypothetical protein